MDWHGYWPTTRTLVFIATISLISGGITGLLPALQSRRRNVADELRSRLAERRGRGGRRLRWLLQSGQGALCAYLLVLAGLIVLSFQQIAGADLGMDPRGVLMVSLEPKPGAVVDRAELYERVENGLRRGLPGLGPMAATSPAPLTGVTSMSLAAEGWDEFPGDWGKMYPGYYRVSPDFFRALRLEIVQGRAFTEDDNRLGAAPAAIVNQTMARRLWPDGRVLGKCLHLGHKSAPCSSVIGIVEDSRREGIVEKPEMLYYLPLKQSTDPGSDLALLLRTNDAGSMPHKAIRKEIAAVAPEVRFARIISLEAFLDPQKVAWRVAATLLSLFGVLAMSVAAIGLYSVLSFEIAQRTHELGVRAALGAGVGRLRLMVFASAMRLTLISLAVGVGLALASSPVISHFLYHVSPTDPFVLTAVILTLLLTAALAGIVPARKASRVDPMSALRAE